jgi:hypothetical protein
VSNQISDTGGKGLLITGNASATTINMANVTLKDNVTTAIAVIDDQATTSIAAAAGAGIQKSTAGAAISIEGGSPNFVWQGPIKNSAPSGGGLSYLLNVSDTANATVQVLGPGLVDTANGIQIIANDNLGLLVDGATITSTGGTGILLDSNTGAGGGASNIGLLFKNTTVNGATTAGVLINNNETLAAFSSLNINLTSTNAIGFQAANSGEILSDFSNSIVTSSTTQPAVSIADSGPLNMTFTSISSAVTAGTNSAMSFTGSSTGTFNVTSSFTVSGSKGTVANDVNNTSTGPVSVTVPPP